MLSYLIKPKKSMMANGSKNIFLFPWACSKEEHCLLYLVSLRVPPNGFAQGFWVEKPLEWTLIGDSDQNEA